MTDVRKEIQMARNTLVDLNDHLFVALERLNEEGLEGDELEAEIQRARAVSGVAETIIENANTAIRAVKMRSDLADPRSMPRMLLGGAES